jgi:hypothetical protein
MDVLNHRFLHFIDAADGRGTVLYLRHDGDYGLVKPPPSSAERPACPSIKAGHSIVRFSEHW